MKSIEHRVAQEAKAVTRKEVSLKAIEGKLSWLHAADILLFIPPLTPQKTLPEAQEEPRHGSIRPRSRSGHL